MAGWKRTVIALAWMAATAVSAYAETTAAGVWETVDDKSGRVRSTVTISPSGGVFIGRVSAIFPGPGEPADPRCDKCSGAKKGQRFIGLQIIEGMRQSGLDYGDGTILDPETGSVYTATMRLTPDGKHLTVRGYIGISAFGRSQVWNRVK